MSDTPSSEDFMTAHIESLKGELAAAKKQAGKTYEQVDLETREEFAACQAELVKMRDRYGAALVDAQNKSRHVNELSDELAACQAAIEAALSAEGGGHD